jgi:NADH:ubiquinone oxidoreductase subunit C
VNNETGNVLADRYISFCRWKKSNFCQLLNVHGINYVRQTELQKAEPLAS